MRRPPAIDLLPRYPVTGGIGSRQNKNREVFRLAPLQVILIALAATIGRPYINRRFPRGEIGDLSSTTLLSQWN